jgi:hypothetical protein
MLASPQAVELAEAVLAARNEPPGHWADVLSALWRYRWGATARSWPGMPAMATAPRTPAITGKLKLYLVCTSDGMPIMWCLANPKIGEREG